MNTPSKEDLNNLFGPMFEEYFKKTSSDTTINSVAQPIKFHDIFIFHIFNIVVGEHELIFFHIILHCEEIDSSTTALRTIKCAEFPQVTNPQLTFGQISLPLDQVIGDPSKPVMTRQRLHTDSEVCMYALTVSTIEPKNIKEAMADHSWIESMQDELNQL
ncbi:hypothetical protein Tco_0296233 [Tanacetum coccineum]